MASKYWTPLTISLLAVIITAGVSVWSRYNANQSTEITIANPSHEEQPGEIYIGGAVNNPGLYPLKASDSIAVLVQAAGGTTTGIESDDIRLYIPDLPQKIDLNRAEVWLLKALPGIGSDRANAIVAYRNQNGYFRNTSELIKVSGIGTKTFQQVEPLVTVAD